MVGTVCSTYASMASQPGDFSIETHCAMSRRSEDQPADVPAIVSRAADSAPPIRAETLFLLSYFALYLVYLFVRPEGELLHWITLVILPLLAVAKLRRARSLPIVLRSIGLDRQNLGGGMGWALLFGAAFQALQLLNRRQLAALVELVRHPAGWLVPVGALGLLLV